ncbi:MAG: multidrug efflux protein [Alteromonadaceae bacterium]|nr:MAG: multidrug efflux protein [Alteromonadaceae bacterium]
MSAAHENNKSIMDIFVTRPLLAIVLSLSIVIAGIYLSSSISVQQFPKIESTSLVVNTVYTGASAEVVKGYITEPIERVASTVPGVDYVDSATIAGSSRVTAWLDLNYDSTAALAELTAQLSQIRFELPQGAQDPAISVVRADRANALFYLNIESGDIPRSKVNDYFSRNVIPVLSDIDGVQKVTLEGGRDPAMRIWIDSDKLAAFNISASQVLAALRENNTIATLGYSKNNRQRIDLMANTLLSTVEEFQQLVIVSIDGTQIKLADVAIIEEGEEEGLGDARIDRKQTTFIGVWPLPGANEIDIGDALYKKIDDLNQQLPDKIRIETSYDGTLYMRNAIKGIFTTLLETVFLVGIVVILMMGSIRSALVPLITIPISILGAIGVMSLMGFSLNLLTILAIVLSVGLVVDDAIVVVENVARQMREGKGRFEAALISSRQLLVPVIAMTLTLAAVYAPIGFLSGLTGFLFREFAFTLAVAVLISGLVAVTLSPIMSAFVSPQGGREGKFTLVINRYFERLQQQYVSALDTLLSWRAQVMFCAIIFSLLVVPFYLLSQQELAPVEDQGEINVVVTAPPEASLEYTTSQMFQVADVMNNLDGGKFTWQIVFKNSGFGGVALEDLDKREKTVHQMLPQLFGQLGAVSSLNLFPILPAALPTAGQFDVEIVIRANDSYENMLGYAQQIINKAYQSGSFMFVDTNLKIDLAQSQLVIDKAIIADLGLTVTGINEQLSVLLSNDFVNQYNDNGKAYRVIPVVDANKRFNPELILDLKVTTPSGGVVTVSSFAHVEPVVGPRLLGSFNQQKSFRILAGVLPHITKEQALSQVEDIATELLPTSYSIDYAGQSREMRTEGNTMLTVLMVSLIVVYFLLAIQFNSFRDPLVVLLGCAPLALSGALMLAFLGFTSVNLYAQIGLITLVGLITKNGILIVEFANQMQLQGMDKLNAVKAAASTRLRPILMTTAATVLGHFPLVLVTGAGAEARNSIGVILVAGMMIGTAFTLIVLPILYQWLATDHRHQALDDARGEQLAPA